MKTLLGVLAAPLRTLFALLGAPFKRLPFCSLPGAVVGSFTGFLMAIFELERYGQPLAVQQLVVVGLMLGTGGLLLVLLLFGLILRYGVGQIFWPAVANALITAILVVLATYWLQMPAIAGFIGLLIGILVGAVLCWLCRIGEGRAHAKA